MDKNSNASLRWSRSAGSTVVLSIIGLASGCGPGYEIADVSGVITNRGKPVEGVFVTFQPAGGSLTDSAGPASYGHTDAEGRYNLRFIQDDAPGAIVGVHRIILQHAMQDVPRRSEMGLDDTEGKSEEDIERLALEYDRQSMAAGTQNRQDQRMIPNKYRRGSVAFEVPPEGTNTANFELAR